MNSSHTAPATWVLLEGQSDVAAVRAVADRAGLGLKEPGVQLIAMGGATNIGRYLRAAAAADNVRVLGMCDLSEAPYFVAALRALGCDARGTADLAGLGFYVCDRDLEDELVRAVGEDGALSVLADLGLTGRFATFVQQQAWAGRPFHDQVRRFAGSASGRKELMARALASAVELSRLPVPLANLLQACREPWTP